MTRPRSGQVLTTSLVRCYNETKDMLHNLSAARKLQGTLSRATTAEALDDLLEVAFRCIADHGADFSKPARHHNALNKAKRKIKDLAAKRRKPGRPKGSKDSTKRTRAAK